jgi:glycolate oxidase
MTLVAALREICGDEHVYTHPHQLRTYESDGLLQYRASPVAVALPGTHDEVVAVVKACHEAGVPFVARGSGSGLSGGALPVEDGVLIGLSRLRRVLEVDLANHRAVVEPGVTNVEVSAAVGPTTSTRRTRRARSSARSAATSPRTRAARTASSTASRRTT